MKRRQFLQFSGSALAAIGLSQIDLTQRASRYGRVLAQETPGTKRALLVGINQYDDAPLDGCITDVLLQRELLMHRFGFDPQNIVVIADDPEVSDIAPTRENILGEFRRHLIDEAAADDVVVFHFSGHGARVFDEESGFDDELNSTFLPIDRKAQVKQVGNEELVQVSDIMGKTLFLLMMLVPTDNFTAVLDSCHAGGGKRGNLKVRAIEGGKRFRRSPEEAELQAELFQEIETKLGLARSQVEEMRKQEIAKGVVIASASREQLAADTPFDGFYAGAFTYALTQYLWQSEGDEKVEDIVNSVSRLTTRISSTRQVPEFEVKATTTRAIAQEQVYFLPRQITPAEAVITDVQGSEVRLWLGGINPQALSAFGADSTFTLLNDRGQEAGLVQLTQRDGLRATAKLLGNTRNVAAPRAGLLLQEEVRAVPSDLPLMIGLADSLTAAEKQAARQMLPKLGKYVPVELNRTEVHYILGRATPDVVAAARGDQAVVPVANSLGLLDKDGLTVIPGSFDDAGESVEAALEADAGRLKSKLRALLASRLIKLVLNADASRMDVTAELEIVSGNGGVGKAAQYTPRGSRGLGKGKDDLPQPVGDVTVKNGILQVPLNSEAKLKIRNGSEQDLYMTALVIDSEGLIIPVFPNEFSSGINDALVPAGATRNLPDATKGDRFKLVVQPPAGTAEVLIVASIAPLRESLQVLEKEATERGTRSGSISGPVEEPLAFVDLLQADLSRGMRGRGDRSWVQYNPEAALSAAAQVAALSITFSVV
ncbi:MAG: DUF4384 domain-containing protein [Synechococcales cyanobacterium RM1_1_8]|nr:DUF4384 domain-containing protein [Synechococcales cyanobacterium RM1_1_8]